MSAPPGANPNLDPYGGLGPLALGVTWALASIATIFVILRCYVLFGMHRKVGQMQLSWTFASWFFGLVGQICLTIDIRAFGIGNHLPILMEAGTLARALLWVWIAQFFALASIGLGKFAAVASIVTIQGDTKPIAKAILWSLAIVNILMDASIAIAIWFQCSPVAKLWNVTLLGQCNRKPPITNLAIAVGSINSASDFILAFYPIYMLWTTQISRQQKLGVLVLLSCVAFAGVCAAVKSSELYNIGSATDPTYDIMHLVIWAFTEQWIVVIAVAVPGLGPLIQRTFKNVGSYDANYGTTNGHTGSHELHTVTSSGKRPRTFVRSEGFRQMPPDSTDNRDNLLASLHDPDRAIVMQQDVMVEQGRNVNRERSMTQGKDEEMNLRPQQGSSMF